MAANFAAMNLATNMTTEFMKDDVVMAMSTATQGVCETGCKLLGPFLVLSLISFFLFFIVFVPSIFVTIRYCMYNIIIMLLCYSLHAGVWQMSRGHLLWACNHLPSVYLGIFQVPLCLEFFTTQHVSIFDMTLLVWNLAIAGFTTPTKFLYF